MICGVDVWVEEELACILIGPVLWNCVSLLRVILDAFYYTLKSFVFPNELDCSIGPDLGNRIQIVTAEKDAKVDELRCPSSA